MSLDGDEWKGEYPFEGEENPMAKMFREQDKVSEQVNNEIYRLHDSLPAKSSDLDLFTFAEIKRWGLKHVRKRAKPGNNDHEADGA